MTDERMKQLARQHGIHDAFMRAQEDAVHFARAVLAEEAGDDLRDQLTAALAEKDRLTAERDETRKELTQCTKDIAYHHDRARVMQEQRDKALAEVREAKRERDALAAALEKRGHIGLSCPKSFSYIGTGEEDCNCGIKNAETILSAYLRAESAPLVEALEEVSASGLGADVLAMFRLGQLADAALAAWREKHPEPPEEGGDAE